MLPYYLLILPVTLMAILAPTRRVYALLWALMFVAVVIFVGLRHRVGMDWNNYLIMIQRANVGSWFDSLSVAEPGYATLLWISGQMGWGIYGAYLIGTLIFAGGLFRYARTTPYPWLALAVAMPILVIVVAMSAARQTVAIGVLLWLIADWKRSSLVYRVCMVMLATSFHMSAVGFLAFVVLASTLPPWLKLGGTALLGGAAFYLIFVTGQADYYDSAYVSGQTDVTQSSGAFYHTLLNGGPAMLAFALGRKSRSILLPDPLHRQLAIVALVCAALVPLASAAAGRMSLYLFPVSMMVLSSLPAIFGIASFNVLVRSATAVFMVALLTIWLSFGNASLAHRVYLNALLVDTHQLVLCCR